MPSESGDLAAQLARIQRPRRQSQFCWFVLLDEDDPVRAFISASIELIEELGPRVSKAEIRKVLVEEYDMDLSREQLNRHLRKDCRCGRED
jgi:hypothetical protein